MPASRNLSHDHAAAHRRRLLQRTRVLSVGIAGGAAIASLGLGTALAHAIPGHARIAGTQSGPPSGGSTGRPAAPAQQASSAPGAAPAPRAHGRRHITPPSQPPASTPAPPQVSSGGS